MSTQPCCFSGCASLCCCAQSAQCHGVVSSAVAVGVSGLKQTGRALELHVNWPTGLENLTGYLVLDRCVACALTSAGGPPTVVAHQLHPSCSLAKPRSGFERVSVALRAEQPPRQVGKGPSATYTADVCAAIRGVHACPVHYQSVGQGAPMFAVAAGEHCANEPDRSHRVGALCVVRAWSHAKHSCVWFSS